MEYRISCYTSLNEKMNDVFQWDANRIIKITGVDFDDECVYQVHFCNRRSKTAFVLEPEIDTITINGSSVKVLVTEIPIELLEMPDAIDVYIYAIGDGDERATVASGKIIVSPRQRPSDYVSETTGNVLAVANGFVVVDGMLYLARDGVAIGTGIDIPQGGTPQVGRAVGVTSGTMLTRVGQAQRATTVIDMAEEAWETGSGNINTGTFDNELTTRLRCNSFTAIPPNRYDAILSAFSSGSVGLESVIYWYAAASESSYLGYHNWSVNGTDLPVPEGAQYFRLNLKIDNVTDMVPTDLGDCNVTFLG